MGEYALLDTRPGGEFTVDTEGTPVRGHYQELDPPNRVVFSWGFAGSDDLPPGSSTVVVVFTGEAGGTLAELVHHALPPSRAPRHVEGWRRYLSRLALAAKTPSIDPPPLG